jgi:hypothetical protein
MLSKTVVHKKGTGSTVNVGPRILDFTSCGKKIRNGFVVCTYQINKIIILNVLLSELEFEDEAWIGLS